MLPFVHNHSNVAQRLLNGLFMEAEHVGTNLRGVKGDHMDSKRIAAVYEAEFRLCPTGGEDKKE